MTKKTTILLLMFSLMFWLTACERSETGAGGTDEHDDADEAKGLHGGRLLTDDDVTLELAIFEKGVPPEFRAWVSQAEKPTDPRSVRLEVTLERLGGITDRIAFEPRDDYLRGTTEVYEPHSFIVNVTAEIAGKKRNWQYDSFEGRTSIEAETARAAGIVIETAGARTIRDVLPLYGVIAPNAENVLEVTARYPGIIRKVSHSIGDSVTKGEVLAIVESDDSLRDYEVTSPIAGVVTQRNANAGAHSGSGAMFTVTDLSSVWAELSVFPKDLPRLALKQPVRVRSVEGDHVAEGEVVRMSPSGTGVNQALTVQVRLDNAERRWTPGLYVSAEALIGGTDVPVSVKQDALQRFRDWRVVFENVSDVYEARPLELGRTDGEWVEVVAGLKPGARYVAANSFLVKADIEKSGASHDH